jgi:hypothetical protein
MTFFTVNPHRTMTAADIEDDAIVSDGRLPFLDRIRAMLRLVRRWLEPTPTWDDVMGMEWAEIVGYQHAIDAHIATQLRALGGELPGGTTTH